MKKQNFIALADTLRANKPVAPGNADSAATAHFNGRLAEWENNVSRMADFCRTQNPQFNRSRWLGYLRGECGPNGGARN